MAFPLDDQAAWRQELERGPRRSLLDIILGRQPAKPWEPAPAAPQPSAEPPSVYDWVSPAEMMGR